MKTRPASVTIVGGTGTLGKALLERITESYPLAQVTVISRDEHKQADLKRFYPKVDFVIGDVRSFDSIAPSIFNRDLVFHVAAMKRVEVCEDNPSEAIQTNLIGTQNVARAATAGGVKHLIFSSTDKAVEPITHYGFTKAAAETIIFNYNKFSKTKCSVYRWGNVLGSQGSVIPYFIQTLTQERKAYITHPEMTRFWLPIDWAVRFMLLTYPDAYVNRAMIPPNMKAARVVDIIQVLAQMLGVNGYTITETGMRGKEKIHESMYEQSSDYFLRSDTCEKYSKEELMQMLSPFVNAFNSKEAS
jgi:UDP-N-acetylglucosamine 4,6-dehydratase